MTGGAGDDTYLVDKWATPRRSGRRRHGRGGKHVTFTLSANVETLALNGTTAIDGTGNAGANTLLGNSAVNRLDGDGGNDALTGFGGADASSLRMVTAPIRSPTSPTVRTSST